MFPLRDSIPSSRPPVVNILLISACTLVFLFELTLGEDLGGFIRAFAFVPARMFHAMHVPVLLPFNVFTILASMFMHGGWLHLIGNMWFLWIFGDNVEDCMGHFGYLAFYVVCGVAAALGQALIDPSSRVPMIGASGAIAGVLGAYLLWFPWSRIKTLIFLGIFFTIAELPAPFFLVVWFVVQFFSGTLSLAQAHAAGGGVAFFAHIGGFIFGLALAWWLRATDRVRPVPQNVVPWEQE